MWSYVTGVNFLQQQSSMNALNGNNNQAHADAYKKIVAQWLETRDDVNDLNNLSYIAGQTLQKFPQAVPLLRKIVMTDGTYGYAKGQALMHLTQQKGKEEIPFLKALLNNETQVQTVWFGRNANQQPVQHQCLLKDVALAYIVTLHGHKMTDYGFKFPPAWFRSRTQIGYGNFAFETDEARRMGMTKWGHPCKSSSAKPADRPRRMRRHRRRTSPSRMTCRPSRAIKR